MKGTNQLFGAAAIFALLFSCGLPEMSARAQGSLIPPGPPAATMLTLSQVEPRTPVDSVHTPGDGLNQYLITQPGSYYLTSNIGGVASKQGINIQTNDVTLDLNGFSVNGIPGSFSGIDVFGNNVVVRNGTIDDWGQYGVYSTGVNVTLEGLNISSNALDGVYLGSDSKVVGNVLVGNNTSDSSSYAGIATAGSDSLIEENHVVASGLNGDGIQLAAGSGNIVIRNYVQGNGANDFGGSAPDIVGPIVNTTVGVATNVNSWANMAF